MNWMEQMMVALRRFMPMLSDAQLWPFVEALDALRDDIMDAVYRECGTRDSSEE
jgi:hypothetical protein